MSTYFTALFYVNHYFFTFRKSFILRLPLSLMNETTLNALINLFALFSAISQSEKEDAIQNFSHYLRFHLGISSFREYLDLFSELLDLYGVGSQPAIDLDMNKQAENISINIRSRLQREEQIMVFLRFLELAKSGNANKAKSLIETISRIFEIGQAEADKFSAFIFNRSKSQLNYPDILVIDRNDQPPGDKLKHILEKKLDGEIVFLHTPLISNLVFICYGNEEMTLEGNPISPGRFYAFREGGIIRGQRISPVYYADIESAFIDKKVSRSLIFEGHDLGFKFKNSDSGLYPFDFIEHSGQLVAVMGGSGVGKSTLLNILNGNILPQHGTITINQLDIHLHKNEIEGLIGYVPQDDLLFEDLTVWENLHYNARLCFDNLGKPVIDEKVTRMLKELELYAIRDLKVGSPLKKLISGGQRKRLNIALELIREPSILFVDEPTSGLSSTDSEKVMLLLKHQARQGKLIIVNIHQPSSSIFKLFDKLWIMDLGGRIIYNGNPLDAIIYFKREVNHVNADICECNNCGNVNPEQVLEIVETKKIDNTGNFTSERRFPPEFWYTLFREKSQVSENKLIDQPENLPGSGFRKPGRAKQFRIFFARNFRIKMTDRLYMLINLLESPVLAAIVAYFTRIGVGNEYTFYENKSLISYIFMAIIVMLFMGMTVSAEEIVKDRKILQRELFLDLSRFSYLNSKALFLFLLSGFQALSFVIVGNLILGIHGMNNTYWLVLFFVALFSNLVGLNISSAFDSVVTIYILIPLLLIPQILLCGVIVKFDDLQNLRSDKDATPFVGDMMVSRWAFEALTVKQFKDNQYMSQFFELEKDMTQENYISYVLINELKGMIDMAYDRKQKNIPATDGSDMLNIVKNETEKLDNEKAIPVFRDASLINPLLFNKNAADSLKTHLLELQNFHAKLYKEARGKRDLLINKINREQGEQWLYEQKMKYHNKSLETLMLKSDEIKLFRRTPNGIMQKTAPVYKPPDFENGRAQFLSSQKNILGFPLDTYWFNVSVIGLFCVFLYIALYYDWLRKLISVLSGINIRKSN
jgi:ABC-type multidrug transport system ATPase subunit